MRFQDIFTKPDCFDVLLIQPNMLQKVQPQYIDPIQSEYWDSLDRIGSLFGDLPIEPNWGLLSISANLKKNGYGVGLLDFHLYDYIKVKKTNEFIDIDDIRRIISLKSFKAVGISSMTLSHSYALEIARICKEVNPECVVLLGGIHFSFLAKEALDEEPAVDGILLGEGEYSFVEFMNHISQRDQWGRIPGFTYKAEDGTVHSSQPEIIEDLDALPFPDYDLWPEDIPIIPRIYTARGCNGGCSYCVVNQFFCNKYRKRKVENAFEELKFVVDKFQCTDVLIGDLNLGACKDMTMEFCRLIIEHGMNIKWWCQTRPDGLDEELLSIMSKAGCVQIGLGIESANEEILESTTSSKMNSNLNTKELCLLIKKFGIEVQGYFIIGLPGETMNSAMNTIKMIHDLTCNGYVDISHISVLVPYPGTPIYNKEEEFDINIISKEFGKYLMNCDYMNAGVPVVSTKDLSHFQLYALWQLALSTAAKNFRNRCEIQKPDMFGELDTFMSSMNLDIF